ncbi:AraC family transcriptional regulator [Frigidibacter oleivorans]|uniref:AraC family transcriptional regulator n=1 Tax=Frigidibacter oleivorans TaxID=2487129 RepID=UPI000F8E53CE|nr:AraC family transcriptional regulator [Frigidibacter oleivorans]
MGFLPSMQADLQGIRATRPLRFREWEGVVADLWHAQGTAGGGGHYLSPHPRIVLFLDEGAEAVELAGPGGALRRASALYVPPGLPIRSRIAATRDFAHVDLHLQAEPLAARLSGLGHPVALDRPMFRMAGEPLRQLARMLAAEIDRPRRGRLLLEGLLLATLAEVFAADPQEEANEDDPRGGGLTPYQLAAVTRLADQRMDRRLAVAELARAAGLSEGWFSHAFKRSTGQTPQRWLTRRRVAAAASLMRADPRRSLAEIAAATGFADQAHLTRAFRAEHGLPPAAWRRGGPTAAAFSAGPSNAQQDETSQRPVPELIARQLPQG